MIVRPVVPPTVPPGSERVRICLRAGMGEDVIRKLAVALEEWVEAKIKEQEADEREGLALRDMDWDIRAKL